MYSGLSRSAEVSASVLLGKTSADRDSPLYIAAASLNRRKTKFAKSRWDVDEYWLKSLFFQTSPPHFFRPPPISRSIRQLPGMKGERDENFGSEKNQSSQLIAAERGGFA